MLNTKEIMSNFLGDLSVDTGGEPLPLKEVLRGIITRAADLTRTEEIYARRRETFDTMITEKKHKGIYQLTIENDIKVRALVESTLFYLAEQLVELHYGEAEILKHLAEEG